MTYEELKEKGTFVGEDDIRHDGLYNGSNCFYLYDDTLYCRHEPTNNIQYDGEKRTTALISDVKETLEKYDEDYWCQYCSRKTYKNLCEAAGVQTLYQELKEKGTLVGEKDLRCNGLYNGSDYYYLYNDTLYCRHEPTNAVTYDGEISTRKIMPDVKETLKTHNEDFWIEVCGREAYKKLCEIHSTKEQISNEHKQSQQIAPPIKKSKSRR